MAVMENESLESNVVSPKKKYIRKNKTALARILLLDGSYLDIQIDVNIYFYIHETEIHLFYSIHKLCETLYFIYKHYILYITIIL